MFKIKHCIFIFIVASGCSDNSSPGKTVVAEVGDKKLYLSEVSSVIPDEMDKNDSLILAEDYIRKWIKQELLLKKAEENLSNENKNVAKELLEYRNSLIIYKYKDDLMSQRMDTIVTSDQIEEYYLSNPESFNLNTEIVKAIYIKIPVETPGIESLKVSCSDNSASGLNNLRKKYQKYAKAFDVFYDRWIEFELLSRNIPAEIPNIEEFLKKNDYYEYRDFNFYYLIYIKYYKLKNELAPLDFVKEKIKNLILNRRKVIFLKQTEESIYTEGLRKKKFKIHNLETNGKK